MLYLKKYAKTNKILRTIFIIFCGGMVSIPFLSLKAIPSDISLGYWDFESANPGKIPDLSGNTNTMVYSVGAELIKPGIVGDQALKFSNGSDVSVPYSFSFSKIQTNQALTVAFWAKVPNISKEQTLLWHKKLSVAVRKKGALQLKYAKKTVKSPEGLFLFQSNYWHHLAFVYDGKKGRLYLDGKLIGDRVILPKKNELWGATPLRLGAKGNKAKGKFEGWLDDVRLYARSLSQNEIVALIGASNVLDPKSNIISVTAIDDAGFEQGADSMTFAIQRSGGGLEAMRIFYQLSGSATIGKDYLSSSTTIWKDYNTNTNDIFGLPDIDTFNGLLNYRVDPNSVMLPLGAKEVLIPIVPADDLIEENTETVVIELLSSPAYTVVNPASATGQIFDSDFGPPTLPEISISVEPSVVSEGRPINGVITIKRNGEVNHAVRVYLSYSGSATQSDFINTLPNFVDLAAGQDIATITLFLATGDGLEGPEQLQITLTQASNYLITGESSATLSIVPPTVALLSDLTIATEAGPTNGTFRVKRSGGENAIRVYLSYSGSANQLDFGNTLPDYIDLALGQSEAVVDLTPTPGGGTEGPEQLIISILPAGEDYLIENASTTIMLIEGTGPIISVNTNSVLQFLTQATLGPTDALVEEVISQGFTTWINNQFIRPVGLHETWVTNWITTNAVNGSLKMNAWWDQVMRDKTTLNEPNFALRSDPLRQRVAFALSEILVISDRVNSLNISPQGMMNYYDSLVKNAFGNYRDILFDVSTHPCMGEYLSHLKNQKADPEINRYPDENYAREIMQLFTIGLWELNIDGTRVMTNGLPIPTYDNDNITEVAEVFTGFSYGPESNNSFLLGTPNRQVPMKMFNDYHDTSTKILFNGTVLPAGTNGLQDVTDAINNLVEHPNCAPFVGRRLIQRLVKSNPSPSYVGRVATAFRDSDGDMKTTIRAILLDPEARMAPENADETQGMLREPYIRFVSLGRAFDAKSEAGIYPMAAITGASSSLGQQPLNSPSVFNFFQPDYQLPGEVSDKGLYSPEFQIYDSITALTIPNHSFYSVSTSLNQPASTNTSVNVVLDLNTVSNLVSQTNIAALVELVNMKLARGKMSTATRSIIFNAITNVPPSWPNYERERAIMALYLTLISPETAIMK